jgi:Alr-MurF fusion protein
MALFNFKIERVMDPFDLKKWAGFQEAGGMLDAPTIIDQIVIDSRRIHSPYSLFVALSGEREDGHNYIRHAAQQGAMFALVSLDWVAPEPRIPYLTLLRVPNPLQAFQQIAKTYRLQLPTKIIGITGSFGKTMVKDLLVSLLQTNHYVAASPESFNSQIGVPLSLLTICSHHQLAIIEAAASQKGEMQTLVDLIRPDYTILTPIGKKHLNTLQDIPTVVTELSQLIHSTSSQGWSLLPQDFLHSSVSLPCPTFKWDEADAQLPHASALTLNQYQIKFPDTQVIQGSIETGHAYFLNLINMAVKAAWLFGVSKEQVISTIKHYRPDPTRTEIWRSTQGYTFINDTYCSDPLSIDRAVNHFKLAAPHERKIFVFGGIREASEADYKRVGQTIAAAHIQQLLLVGKQSFSALITSLEGINKQTEILVFPNYEEAFNYLNQFLHPRDIILLKGQHKLSLEQLTTYFHDSLANNQCTINLAAIQANLALIRQKLPVGTRLMIIVKALAYGTDSVQMAKCLVDCGIDILGVSYVDEGIALKREGVSQKIFAINAAPYEVNKVVKWDLEVGVSDEQLIDLLAKEAGKYNKIVPIHLHINTGMSRFGCRPENALALAQKIVASPFLKLEGVMTHLACADDPQEDAFTYSQITTLDQVVDILRQNQIDIPWVHAANSSGVLRFHLPQYNMVRIGLAMFGLYLSEDIKELVDLRLAFSLTSRIVGINECLKGETVSYGRHYCVEKDVQRIAVLPIGYFDGLHRHYSGRAHVLIRGQKAPMVGNICMDYMMVDVTDINDVCVGDKVLIFGEDEFGHYLSPEELATSGDSIIHELITCLGPRIQRIFVYEEGKQFR